MSMLWLELLGVAITGGLAAYFGAYLGEKAKNRALREDLDTVIELTEQIKARVSGGLWLEQERWKLKAPVYQDLFVSLNEMANVSHQLQDQFPALAGVTEPPNDYIAGLDQRLRTTIADIRRLRATAALWLREEAGRAIDMATNDVKSVLEADPPADDERWEEMFTMIDVAVGMLIIVAREDLQIGVPSPSPAKPDEAGD